ncbi:MAG: hypothetical protein II218_08185 [Peptococcaceae bacterium]|nr:hypothetical protein [Peptococcaceae bacterium]
MLAKLLKYEMKASARTLIPLYIGTLVVAAVCSIQMALFVSENRDGFMMHIGSFQTDNMLTGIFFLMFFALCISITVLTIMTVIQRFNASLIGDEGYLMFTLPVTHTQLLGSKFIGAMLWSVIGIIVMFLSSFMISASGFIMNVDAIYWQDLWQQLSYIIQETVQPMLITIIYGFFSLAATILLIYLSIMIAQTEKLNNHRVAAAVILFFLLNWLFGAVESVLFVSINGIAVPDGFRISEDFMWAYNMVMACQIAFEAVKGLICFIGTKWLMQNKLNL